MEGMIFTSNSLWVLRLGVTLIFYYYYWLFVWLALFGVCVAFDVLTLFDFVGVLGWVGSSVLPVMRLSLRVRVRLNAAHIRSCRRWSIFSVIFGLGCSC